MNRTDLVLSALGWWVKKLGGAEGPEATSQHRQLTSCLPEGLKDLVLLLGVGPQSDADP